jgi:toxin ParE1/3/4
VPDILFLPAARQELLAAVDHYEAVSSGLGEEFIAEVEHAVARVATFPDHGSPYFADTRRIVLRKFPFDVVYCELSHGLLVVAIAHHRRKPFDWRTRL